MLGGTYGIASSLGAPFGWATGIAWAVALAVAFIAWRWSMYRAYARYIMDTPDYQENRSRADDFFSNY